MDHRTYGTTRNCKGCRFWSERIAMSDASTAGQVKALCLAKAGPLTGTYTFSHQACIAWKSGHHGAVDEPGSDNSTTYAQEES